METIAIIMTVRNRKNITKRGIESIINANKNKYNLYFYITDDGSTDGTDKMLQEIKEKNKNCVFIITKADGNQYWCGGMRISYGKALENENIDYYLLANDDVDFFENFLDIIMNDYKEISLKYDKVLLTAPVKDKITGEVTYGAFNIDFKNMYRYFRHPKHLLEPNSKVQECNLINGNCVLINKTVAKYLGNLDDRFAHIAGDRMYGLKLIEMGGKCFLASEYVGYCNSNPIEGTWQDESLPLIKRIKLKHDIKVHPPKMYIIYLKKVLGKKWIGYFIYQYIIIFVTSLKYKINKRKHGETKL